MSWRTKTRPSDRDAIDALVAATGFFTPEEQAIAVELVDEELTRGADSGYQFLFADAAGDNGALSGYACFGRIPATESSFDLYWIAVAPQQQGLGLGRKLLQQAEAICLEQGGTQMFVDTSGREKYAATRAFYERMGYRKAAVLEDFYAAGDSKVIYAKTLA